MVLLRTLCGRGIRSEPVSGRPRMPLTRPYPQSKSLSPLPSHSSKKQSQLARARVCLGGSASNTTRARLLLRLTGSPAS